MSRGVTLAALVTRLKAEVGDAQEANTFADQEYKYLLATKQQDFANGYDWDFLERRWDLACAGGSRYLTLPTVDIQGATNTISFERPILVERLYNTKYAPVTYGIGSQQYNYLNSDLGQSMDPIQNWRMSSSAADAASPNQVEIWPIPQTSQVMRFTGQRALNPLLVDADKADLDDLLLIYFVAAERLLLRDQKSAAFKFKQAEDHLVKLRAAYAVNEEPIKIGARLNYERDTRCLVPMVIVHG